MAEAAVRTKPMTFEEAALVDPDRQPGELVSGEWIPVTKNTWRHGEVLLNVGLVLKGYVRTHAGWSVSGGDPGTKLSRTPDTLRGPDVAVARTERRPTGRGAEGWLEGGPEVAIEIAGDAQPTAELMAKALEYIGAGSQMVWLLDAEAERVVVVTPPNQYQVLAPDDTLSGGEVLPGFSCTVRELFE